MIRIISLFTFIVFIFGCNDKYADYVTTDQNLTIEESVLESENLLERYKEYWYYFGKGDYDNSYEYELPYLNFLKSLEWYKEFHQANQKNYRVTLLSVTVEKNNANIVYMRSRFTTPTHGYELSDKWLRINNKWYHYYSQSILPPAPKPLAF